MQRRSGPGGLLLLSLLALLLGGCLSNTQVVQIGMLGAPLSYLLAALTVHGLCGGWQWRAPQVSKRLSVLALPALGLLLLDLAYLMPLPTKELSQELKLFVSFSGVLIPLMALPLMGVLALVWRLWYALAPRSSLEGAALLGSALFFTPGVLLSHSLITDPHQASELTGLMLVFCLYGGMMGAPAVAVLLLVEAKLTRRSAEKSADPERLR